MLYYLTKLLPELVLLVVLYKMLLVLLPLLLLFVLLPFELIVSSFLLQPWLFLQQDLTEPLLVQLA